MFAKLKNFSVLSIFLLAFCIFLNCISSEPKISEENFIVNDALIINCVIFEYDEIFEAVNEFGEKNISINFRPTPYKRKIKNILELYAMNLAYEDEFKNLMKNLQSEVGGELLIRPEIKSQQRVLEKFATELKGDFEKISDILAASLVFDNEKNLLAAFEKIKNRDDVVKIKNRWSKPLPNGYRDIKINFSLSNGAIVELQLHHKAIMQVKNGIDHDIYAFIRTNEKNFAMKNLVDRARNFQIILYESVWSGKFEKISVTAKKNFDRNCEKSCKADFAERIRNFVEQIGKNFCQEYLKFPPSEEFFLRENNFMFAENIFVDFYVRKKYNR